MRNVAIQFWLHTDPMEPPHSHSCLMTSQLCHSASEHIHLCLYCIHLFLKRAVLVPEGSSWWITDSSPRIDSTTHGIPPSQLSGIRRWLFTFRTNSGVWFFYFYFFLCFTQGNLRHHTRVLMEETWLTARPLAWSINKRLKLYTISCLLFLLFGWANLTLLGSFKRAAPEDLELSILCKLGQSSFCLDSDIIRHPAMSFFK